MSKESFLRSYISFNKDTEIPELFALWSGISALSAVLGRRVWLDMGVFTVYPNFFVTLVAGSGRCRKSTAISVMEKLVRQVTPPPNIIAQKITPEALIDAMSQIQVKGTVIGEPVCQGFVIADEMVNFLNRRGYEAGMAGLLNSLFDCKDKFDYRTKGAGEVMISKACLGLLSGSTIDLVREAFPEGSIGSGLTSRFIYVYVDQPNPPIARPVFGSEKKQIFEFMIRFLSRVAVLEGEMKMTDAAWSMYQEEYDQFYKHSSFHDNRYLSGYASRRSMHLQKLAMITCISETGGLLIDHTHIAAAKEFLLSTEASLANVMNLIAANEKGEIMTSVLHIISSRKQISRSDLLRMLSHRMDAGELSQVIDTLVIAKKVEVIATGATTMFVAIRDQASK